MKILRVDKDRVEVEFNRRDLERILDSKKDETGEFHGCFDYSDLDLKGLLDEIIPGDMIIED